MSIENGKWKWKMMWATRDTWNSWCASLISLKSEKAGPRKGIDWLTCLSTYLFKNRLANSSHFSSSYRFNNNICIHTHTLSPIDTHKQNVELINLITNCDFQTNFVFLYNKFVSLLTRNSNSNYGKVFEGNFLKFLCVFVSNMSSWKGRIGVNKINTR